MKIDCSHRRFEHVLTCVLQAVGAILKLPANQGLQPSPALPVLLLLALKQNHNITAALRTRPVFPGFTPKLIARWFQFRGSRPGKLTVVNCSGGLAITSDPAGARAPVAELMLKIKMLPAVVSAT